MKRQIGILTIVAAFSAIGLFYPQQQADALPGWGGTITDKCTVRMCTSGCYELDIKITVPIYNIPVGFKVTIDSGATYELVKGVERSCGTERKSCSWTLGCKA